MPVQSRAVINIRSVGHHLYRLRRHEIGYEAKDRSVALIAQVLLDASDRFTSIIPVRIEYDFQEPTPIAVCYYALAITLVSGLQTILPLCI